MSTFQYQAEILTRYPTIIGGILLGQDLHNGPSSPELQERYLAEQRHVLETIGQTPLSQLPSLTAWRGAFRGFGVDPTQYRCAAEALLRRLTKKGDIPSINQLVDIGNLISIRSALPVSVIDTRSIQGALTVRFASGEERYTILGQSEVAHPEPGEVIFVDESDLVFTRRWCWRQSEASAAQDDTTSILIIIEALHAQGREEVTRALRDIESLLRTYAGGVYSTHILDAQHAIASNERDQEKLMQTTNEGRGVTMEKIPAQRISQVFEQASQEKRCALMPYLMSGFPYAEQSVKLILAAAESGADIIEVGMPFSDPLADGATVQHAGQIALERGMSIKGCMEVARQVSVQTSVPLVLMGYYNPVLAFGLERFCQMAYESGVCGLIIPDLPPEEAEPLRVAAQKHGLALIFLIPPTAPDARIARVAELAAQNQGGFVYCVSLSGVTGARKELPPHLHEFIQRVRRYTDPHHLPLAIGFGLSTPEHVAQIAEYADGAVVGSALVHLIDQHEEGEQEAAVRQYIQSLRQK